MPPTTSSRTVHPTVIVAILCASGIAVSLMQTMIVPLISTLPQILATSNSNAAWALTVTLLVGAITTPIGGRLGDMYGKKLVLLISVGGVVVGSVVCALSDGLALFLVGRGLQGIGVATISLGISIMRDCVPPERLGKAVAAMSASLGVGGALGLPIAAVIAQVTWHALFWVAAGFALACWLGIALIVPKAPGHRSAGFDEHVARGIRHLGRTSPHDAGEADAGEVDAGVIDAGVGRPTANFAHGPAMTEAQAQAMIERGAAHVRAAILGRIRHSKPRVGGVAGGDSPTRSSPKATPAARAARCACCGVPSRTTTWR